MRMPRSTTIATFAHFFLIASLTLAHGEALACDAGTEHSIESPNRRNQLVFCLVAGRPHYALSRDGAPLIQPSALGLDFSTPQIHLGQKSRLVSHSIRNQDRTWEQPWGEERFIREAYQELRVDLREENLASYQIYFKIFDDGLGFRYEVASQKRFGNWLLARERTQFHFLENFDTWSIPAYESSAYELLFEKHKLRDLGRNIRHTPFTMGRPGLYLSIHEAALVRYSSMQLVTDGSLKLEADLAPATDGVLVRGSGGFVTPWRSIQIAESPGDLITSYLVLNLNEPNRLADTSYIQPLKFIGIWWGMHLGQWTWGSGPTHGATTANAMRYIDDAVSLGMGGVLVEGWNLGWDDWKTKFDFVRPYPDFDLPRVAAYAQSRGIELVGHHETGGDVLNYESQMEAAFALYRDLGIRSVKTGYVAERIAGEFHYGQRMVEHFQHVVERAAAYGIAINAHEPVKDTGLRRTYPNFLTREGGRGNEYEAWGGPDGNPPNYTTILPFTRGLSGPFDFTPGIFALLAGRMPGVDRAHTTLAKQLAYFVVIYSPMQMAADLPENYFAEPAAFRFIRDVPVDWHTTRVLNGEIGEYITVARRDRASEDWYIGSLTNERGRNLSLKLDFLSPDRQYCAEVYRDRAEADWQTNPFAYELAGARVTSSSTMNIYLAPGGGQAVRITPCDR